ncbi:hypothetical protein [Streptomyces sp. NPDC127084]|uniref:hypothetical protein n=1 Tax=Streptomyces sp. NPDC127084 TaxID=3347133 RepID=UPI0036677D83
MAAKTVVDKVIHRMKAPPPYSTAPGRVVPVACESIPATTATSREETNAKMINNI